MRSYSMQGFLKLEAVRVDSAGRDIDRRILADWFPNLLTDKALELEMTQYTHVYYCAVGSGSTPPTILDTSLESIVGTYKSKNGDSWPPGTGLGPDSSPRYVKSNATWSFALGAIVGNISEIGIFRTSGGDMGSRSLIKDSNGNPTTVTLQASEYLVTSYECRYYQSEIDIVGTCLISGQLYNWTSRLSALRDTSRGNGWDLYYNKQWIFGGWNEPYLGQSGYGTWCYNGEIGSILGRPAGSKAGCSGSVDSYVPGSLKRGVTFSLGLGTGNLSGGILSFNWRQGTGVYQLGFDASIPKDDTNTLTLPVEISIARYVAP